MLNIKKIGLGVSSARNLGSKRGNSSYKQGAFCIDHKANKVEWVMLKNIPRIIIHVGLAYSIGPFSENDVIFFSLGK